MVRCSCSKHVPHIYIIIFSPLYYCLTREVRTAVTVNPVLALWGILWTSVLLRMATQLRPLSQAMHAVKSTWSR